MIRYGIICEIAEDTHVSFALQEMKEWFSKAYDGEIIWEEKNTNADIILRLCQAQDAPAYGFHIVTEPHCATVYARTGQEMLYGVYGLLEALFDFVPYAANEVGFTPRAYTVLPQKDIRQTPSFPWRMYLCCRPYRQLQKNRLRVQDELWAGPGGRWFHTSLAYLPYETYGQAHSQWYSEKGPGKEPRQLCYSEMMDDEEAYALFLENAKQVVRENPGKPNLSVTQEDSSAWCTCPKCTRAKEKYGAEAAPMLLFINRLARDIRAWREAEGMTDELNIVTFAYYRTLPAPVRETPNGYVPSAPEMVLEDNVGVIYAPIEMDYSKPFTHPDNERYAENLRRWRVLCKKLCVWIYQTNFYHFLAPYDWFPTTQENYRFCRDLNVHLLYDEGQYGQINASALNELKTFLTARLMWDADADQELWTNRFIHAYYGAAAPLVRKYYDEVLENNARWHKEVGIGAEWYIYFKILRKDVWHECDLRRWQDYFRQAIEEIEASNEDADRKRELCRRVQLEALAPRYLLTALYDTSYEERKAFLEELNRLEVRSVTEWKTVDKFSEEWLDPGDSPK